jgi:hypothetical protein
METINQQVFDLYDQGLSAGKIAQKLKIKKAVVLDVLGNAVDKGLGDKVEMVTEALGIKALVEAVSEKTGVDCRCAARKGTLNKLFPSRKLNDLLIEDYEYLKEYFSTKKHKVSPAVQRELVFIYNRIFNAKRQFSGCGPCVAKMTDELKRILDGANN